MDDYASFGILSGTCTGLWPNQFNLRYSMSKDKLFTINFNIRSFNSNFDQFAVFLDELERAPDLIILTETWNSDDKNAEINGFISFHCNRSFTQHARVLHSCFSLQAYLKKIFRQRM